ncbi:MAG: GntR family transcriptional regulator, partial [Rubrivivax sp.]
MYAASTAAARRARTAARARRRCCAAWARGKWPATLPHDGDMSLSTATPTPMQRTNLAEQVYAQLKAELHDFTWVPGDRFSEAEIGQRVGVSRTPVREALFR